WGFRCNISDFCCCCWAFCSTALWRWWGSRRVRRWSRITRPTTGRSRTSRSSFWTVSSAKTVQGVGNFRRDNPHLRRLRVGNLGEYLKVLVGQQISIRLTLVDCFEYRHNGFCFSVCSQNRSLSIAFSLENCGLTLTFSLQDFGLFLSFSGQARGATITFRSHLLFHRILDGSWGINSFDFNTGHPQTPLRSRLIQNTAQLRIDGVTRGQCFFKIHETNHVTNRCGGQVLYSCNVVGNAVGRCGRIVDLKIHHGIDRDHEVVFGNDRLRRKSNYLFTHVDQRQHLINKGDHHGEPCHLRTLILTKSLDNTAVALRHNFEGLRQDGYHEDSQHN